MFGILPIHKYLLSAGMFGSVLMLASCELINPDEPVPAYLACDSIQFQTSSPNQGSNSSAISDMWVYVDNVILGTFELPARVPALVEGTHTITIRPGIMVNGISSSRTAYQHYTSYDTTIVFEKEKTYTLIPRSTYKSAAVFLQLEDFEQSGLTFSRAVGSDTTLNIISDQNTFEGRSGSIYLDTARSYFEYYSSFSFQASQGSLVYCELNFKCDQEFLVGLIAVVGSQQYKEGILTIRSSADWNKIYINLTDIVNAYPTASGFKLVISASLPASKNSSAIYLDNIKVIK